MIGACMNNMKLFSVQSGMQTQRKSQQRKNRWGKSDMCSFKLITTYLYIYRLCCPFKNKNRTNYKSS